VHERKLVSITASSSACMRQCSHQSYIITSIKECVPWSQKPLKCAVVRQAGSCSGAQQWRAFRIGWGIPSLCHSIQLRRPCARSSRGSNVSIIFNRHAYAYIEVLSEPRRGDMAVWVGAARGACGCMLTCRPSSALPETKLTRCTGPLYQAFLAWHA
jgi:hypothetical protein